MATRILNPNQQGLNDKFLPNRDRPQSSNPAPRPQSSSKLPTAGVAHANTTRPPGSTSTPSRSSPWRSEKPATSTRSSSSSGIGYPGGRTPNVTPSAPKASTKGNTTTVTRPKGQPKDPKGDRNLLRQDSTNGGPGDRNRPAESRPKAENKNRETRRESPPVSTRPKKNENKGSGSGSGSTSSPPASKGGNGGRKPAKREPVVAPKDRPTSGSVSRAEIRARVKARVARDHPKLSGSELRERISNQVDAGAKRRTKRGMTVTGTKGGKKKDKSDG